MPIILWRSPFGGFASNGTGDDPTGSGPRSPVEPARPAPEAKPGEGDLCGLVGHSPVMLRLLTRLRIAAGTDLPLLIHGATGTGKEGTARAAHQLSPRRKGPFIPLNCTGLTASLLESELFGHVKGAFTGAVRDKKGLFEVAHGGTLFLDEIGDMPLEFQPKFLRALESGEVKRVGSDYAQKFDVRIVAATWKDLRDAMAKGTFRPDLFQRLSGVELHLPLLRDRPGDLRLLVQHFLALHAQPGITHRLGDDAMARLAAYPFPGNVRELGMVIKRAIAFCPTGVITARDLEFTSDEGRPEAANVAPCAHLQDPEWLFTGDKPLATSIYEIVVRAVQHHGGNLTAAARQLGIDRSTIRRILGQAGTVSTLAPVRRLSRRPRSGGGQSCG